MKGKPADIRVFSIISVLLLCVFLWAGSCPLQAATSALNSPEDGSVRLLEDREYFPAFMKAIDGAKSEIVMSFFLFKTSGYSKGYTDRILAQLVRAAKRGVRVRILLEKDDDARNSQTGKSNRETAARLKKKGIDVRFDSPDATTHTKIAVIDKRYIFLGSHNLTNSALKYNHELSVFIDSPSMAMETLEYINSLHK
ncbi:MAG: hypothetical protein KAT81_02415, partial [Syntrophobacterales bacterium]|nr:hypothetical protein [Syntrophobacterales bacterium]